MARGSRAVIDGEEITGFGKHRDDPDLEPERQRSTEVIVDFVLRFVFGDA
jgi:hypothetical protein